MSEPKPFGEMTPSELLHRHNRLYMELMQLPECDRQPMRDQRIEIAAELDRRCEAAGISLSNGAFMYKSTHFKQHHFEMGVCYQISMFDLPASEQHALEAWLLQKQKTK